MIRQRIHLEKYEWDITIFYSVSYYAIYEIMAALADIDCEERYMRQAYNNIYACDLNTGLTYSNSRKRESVMVIGLASSAREYFNSITHETTHAAVHIAKASGMDTEGEDICYIAGEIARSMYPAAKNFLCRKCLEKMKNNADK